MSSPAQGKQEADRILVARKEKLAGRSPYPTQDSRGSCAEHLQSVGAEGALQFASGMDSPGPQALPVETPLSVIMEYTIRGGYFPPFTALTSVSLCINTIRFESSITKANKAGLGRDSKIT